MSDTTNLSLSVDVLKGAKALNLNLSQLCDDHLHQQVRQERWRSEHAEFISAYNATLQAEGLPQAQWSSF